MHTIQYSSFSSVDSDRLRQVLDGKWLQSDAGLLSLQLLGVRARSHLTSTPYNSSSTLVHKVVVVCNRLILRMVAKDQDSNAFRKQYLLNIPS